MKEARIGILLALIAVVCLAVVGGIVALFLASVDTAIKIGAAGDLLAGGAFVLATVAAAVATLAYRVTILKPILKADVRFGHGFGGLTLTIDPHAPNAMGRRAISPWIQCDMHIHLHNYGEVSARNPALRVRLEGMMFPPKNRAGWVLGDHFHGVGGYGWAQWDGGADYSIHPKWGRDLPILGLYGVTIWPDLEPGIVLELVADGFSQTIKLPVIFKESENLNAEPSGASSKATDSPPTGARPLSTRP